MMTDQTTETGWMDLLDDEDRAFIKRFVLASGSLKAVAEVYGVSYPTIRLRLDRVIQKIQLVDEQKVASPFERLLRAKYADGAIDLQTLKSLLKAHEREIASNGPPGDPSRNGEDR